MVKNCLLLGLLILVVTAFTLGDSTEPNGEVVPADSQDSGGASADSLAGNEYPFLNEGLDYRTGSVQEWEISDWQPLEDFPEDLRGVAVDVADESELYEQFGYFGHVYWVQGEPTPEKLRLMEYDLLTRVALRELHVSVTMLHFLTEGSLLGFGRRLHHGWHLLREMKYPEAVSGIHERYLEATEASGWYLRGTPNSTMTYRAISETGVGGVRASGYNAHSSTELIYQATLDLMDHLEGNGIRPY